MNSLWHKVSFDKGLVGIVEMSNGTTLNTKIDSRSGCLRLESFLNKPVPSNYGFIPQTMSDNDKPLEVFMFCSCWLPPLSIIPIVPERIIHAMDGDVGKAVIVSTVRGDRLEWVGAERRTHLVCDYLETQKPGVKVISVLDHKVATMAISIAHSNYKDHHGIDLSKIEGDGYGPGITSSI